MKSIEKSIVATLALYEFLGSAPTATEVWERLVNPEKLGLEDDLPELPSLRQVKEILETGQVAGVFLGSYNEFYYLEGSKKLAKKRQYSLTYSQEKISLAVRRLKKVLPWTPFIEGVALEGSVAEERANKDSDIDLLVIISSGRIWTARAVLDRLLFILGWRRYGNNTKDKFCLNHFLTPQDLKTEPGLYHAFLHSHLMPLYERTPGVWQKFLQKNAWIGEFLPNMNIAVTSEPLIREQYNGFSKRLSEVPLRGVLGDPIENTARKVQQKIIQNNPLTHQKGGRVRVDDNQLEFHPVLLEGELQTSLRQRFEEFDIDK